MRDAQKHCLTCPLQVQEIFIVYKDHPPINYNAPPRAGAVAWVRGLIERIQVK
jgi:hypothetical protein